MADVRAFPALHYDLNAIGALGDVLAPPYDVIERTGREARLSRSPFNVVEVDMPEAPGGDRYEHAAGTLEEWILSGILRQDREPTIWAITQRYDRPDGGVATRNAILARVRVEDYGAGRIRPHERTQPGPRQDRLDLTRATRTNLSPIFSLTTRDAWPHVAEATREGEPWAEALTEDGTLTRVWRIADPEVHRRVSWELDQAELLIADGHHRYETARTYRDEVGGEGAHRYTLMALTGLDDPGLTVFPTHRLLSGLDDPDLADRLDRGLDDAFETVGEGADPDGLDGPGCFGLLRAGGDPRLIRLRDPGGLDALMEGRSPAYRELDAAILERAVLAAILGMSESDVEAKRGLAYARSIEDASRAVARGEAQAAFILRPTPIEQVRAVADAGETMPPKSTYFFPKIPTGIVFNPLS